MHYGCFVDKNDIFLTVVEREIVRKGCAQLRLRFTPGSRTIIYISNYGFEVIIIDNIILN